MATTAHTGAHIGPAQASVMGNRSRQSLRARIAVVGDFGAGKDGTMSAEQAGALYNRLKSRITTDGGASIGELDDATDAGFQLALYAYLALNTGSTSAEDGFAADADSVTYITWMGHRLAATDLREELGSSAYRYMRAVATDIKVTIELLYARARGSRSDEFPMAVEFVNSMNVVAAKRGMAENPQFAFVGAEYVEGVSPKQRKVILEAASNVLSNRTHVREDARSGIMRAQAAQYT